VCGEDGEERNASPCAVSWSGCLERVEMVDGAPMGDRWRELSSCRYSGFARRCRWNQEARRSLVVFN
jgi:hypothetical protein